jgi:UDP-4-amino-4,6-dideoxy-N-acetyl-beta-L-altrosamine N-acetyltransferase
MEIIDRLKKDLYIKDLVLKNFINLDDEEKEIVRGFRNNYFTRKWCYHENTISLSEHNEFIKELEKDNHNLYWLVEGSTGFIGVISLNRIDFENRNAYMGIYSKPGIKKVGSLLIECLKSICFDLADLHTLKLEVIDGNEKAINLYKKSGFSEEGRIRDFTFKEGKYRDVILMGIINGN